MEFDFVASLPSIAPEIALTVLAVVLLFLDSYSTGESRRRIPYVAAIGMGFIALLPLIFAPPSDGNTLYWGGLIRYDALAQIFKVMVIIGGALTAAIAVKDRFVGSKGEFYMIITIATLGASLMGAAADLIMIFIALETMTIPLYVLASFGRKDKKSSESGMKYFLFGSFASAILLYGFSLLFGFSGTTSLTGIAEATSLALSDGGNIVPLLIAVVLVLVGFGFKISAVPFHFWTPDVYEGAPTPVTAYISTVSKAASFALLIRFFLAAFPSDLVVAGQSIQDFWVNLAVVFAVITMTFGNVLALRQSNIKRMLAYSSIAQAGYVLIAVAAIGAEGDLSIASISFYLFMYIFTNILAFGVIVLFAEATNSEEIRDLGGLNHRSPWLALLMTIALLSLGGIPPTAGFVGKFFIFQSGVEANLVGLVIIGVLNSIIALYYYLVVIKVMYVDESGFEDQKINISLPYGIVFGIMAGAVLLLGTVLATPVLEWAREGAIAVIGSL